METALDQIEETFQEEKTDKVEVEIENDLVEECERIVLNNNYLLPLEPVDVPCEEEQPETKRSKKNDRVKKDGRFYKFVKRHFLHRKHNTNDVREIHIVPEGDELKWARRSAGSAASRSSDETGSSEDDRLEVVHDMDEEYNSES